MTSDNPPAFPSVCLNDPDHPASIPGMTLGDYFAGQWLASCASSGAFDKTDAKEIAEEAYAYADAMLAERERHS